MISKKRIRGQPARSVVNSGYSEGGASITKKTLKTYQPRHYSAKEDIDRNLQTLRNRAADLAINSAVGAGAIHVETSNVIGAGLKLFPRIKHNFLGMSAQEAREWARKTKQEFSLWADSALACDYLRRNNFYELQKIAFMSYLTEGDNFCVFKRRVPTKDNPYSLRLLLIEAARVSNPQMSGTIALNNIEMRRLGTDNRIINGIEVNANGALEAVWISNRQWDEPTTLDGVLKWQRVKFFGERTGLRNVLHICADTRPGQFRGVPFLAPVIESLKQLSRYSDAELTSAIIKSFFSIFFVQPANNFDMNQITGASAAGGNSPVVDVNEYRLGPATMAALPRGVDVKAVDSSNAQSTFDEFTGAFLKQIGAGIGVPYEILLKNFSASYSASRAALLQAADEFRQRKAYFVHDFCQPIYENFLIEAISLGRIDAPGFFDSPEKRAAWLSADWFTEQTRFLDPVKEAEGIRKQIELGLTTREKAAVELAGTDFWENVEMLQEENKLMSKIILSNEQPAK